MDVSAYYARIKDTNNPLDHEQVMAWTAGPLADKLNDAELNVEAYSKIYTYIVKRMEGEIVGGEKLSFGRLEGGIINIVDFPTDVETGQMGNNYGASFGNPARIG